MAYTSTEIAAALVAPARVWAFRFERIGLTSDVMIGAEDVVSCTISNNDLATEVKRTCRVLLPPDTTFDYLSHSLRAYARLLMLDGGYQEWCVGTFYLATPTRQPDSPRDPIDTSGFDWTLRAATTRYAQRIVSTDLTAFANYGNLLGALLTAAGWDAPAIDGSAYATALPTTLEWEPGTSVLEMVNSLLAGLNFKSLFVDVFGNAICEPYADPTSATATWAYTRDSASVTIHGSTVIELDTFETPNQWVGAYSAPDVAPLLYVKTNAEPSSPYSTVSRGRTITRWLDSDEVGTPPDLTALQARVERFAGAASQQLEEVTFSTGLMPFHGTGDALDVDTGAGPTRYREHTWEMELRAGGQMKHVVRRTVTL